jgi:hypothetical protein
MQASVSVVVLALLLSACCVQARPQAGMAGEALDSTAGSTALLASCKLNAHCSSSSSSGAAAYLAVSKSDATACYPASSAAAGSMSHNGPLPVRQHQLMQHAHKGGTNFSCIHAAAKLYLAAAARHTWTPPASTTPSHPQTSPSAVHVPCVSPAPACS